MHISAYFFVKKLNLLLEKFILCMFLTYKQVISHIEMRPILHLKNSKSAPPPKKKRENLLHYNLKSRQSFLHSAQPDRQLP